MEKPLTTVNFNKSLTPSDPESNKVLIIGQYENICQAGYKKVKCKLLPRVTEEMYSGVLDSLRERTSLKDNIPLYLDNKAILGILPSKCSRHNSSSRNVVLTKMVKKLTNDSDSCIVVICEKANVYASACAIARVFPLYSRKSSDKNRSQTITVEFVTVDERDSELTDGEVKCLKTAAEGIQLTARIVDTPCSDMHTDIFIKEVQKVGEALGIKALVIQGEELKERGFMGIYSVGQAALHAPALVVLSHEPVGATETVAWVGKGIVYDTGGLSIKTKTSMPGMKRDCGGAAAVLGSFYVAVKMGFEQNLHAVFCLAENAVGPKSTRPDDIITMYSGRSVEINNTDAEGRLVLGDGVVYADRDLKADIILDMATLTGAQGVSTGKHHSAILTNSEEWEQAVVRAGRNSGDLAHPLPYCPELHFSEFASAVADMKNSVADRSNATSACAGLFIGAHLGFEDYSGVWIHVDIASPVHAGDRATGYGVALLTSLFGYASKEPMLQSLSPFTQSDSNSAKRMRLA